MLDAHSKSQHVFKLSKFSYATTSQGYNGPIPWTHLMSDTGLFAVFEASSTQDTSQGSPSVNTFKVLHEPQILVSHLCVAEVRTDMCRRTST